MQIQYVFYIDYSLPRWLEICSFVESKQKYTELEEARNSGVFACFAKFTLSSDLERIKGSIHNQKNALFA